MHLYFNIHRTDHLFFKLHEIINKHVLAIIVCYYSFCNEILMILVFFQRYKYFLKDIFHIYVILDFTPYENNVSFQFLIFINKTYFTQIFSLFLQYLTSNTGTSQVIINKDANCKNSIVNCNNIYGNIWNRFFQWDQIDDITGTVVYRTHFKAQSSVSGPYSAIGPCVKPFFTPQM